MIGMKVEGPKIEGLGKKILQHERPAAVAAVKDVLQLLYDEVMLSFSLPKHGRLYRKKDGSIHQASAPGEAPAIDTAELARSIYIVGPNWKGWTVQGHVASRLRNKPKWLEFGTSRMAPRPFFRPAIRRIRRKARRRMSRLRFTK
jgi:hypothetical protein